MTKVFIDGSSGTTGLRIHDRLSAREDIELISIPEEKRKDPEAIAKAFDEADVAFLCLPDDAAREAVAINRNPNLVILDTSTAHRTEPGWVYGLPELGQEQREAIKSAKRIAVPGCHASGFIALVTPLVKAGIIAPGTALSTFSITGYSGGGKKMIAQYEDFELDPLLVAPRQYGVTQTHKHLKEMVAISGIGTAPIFCPIVSNFYSGMEFTVQLFAKDLVSGKTAEDIKAVYQQLYTGPIVKYSDAQEGGFLSGAWLESKDTMEVGVFGNEERILLTARYDNLGKGASGAAVECLNLVMGVPETTGLEI